jgi:ABC-type cobalamin/Fe3+-siderophores transport system ATPase subunit
VIIDSVEVHGFWDNKKAFIKFNQDVTILIGRNGTGKTTFVNLIAAILSVDTVQLSMLQFESVKIKLIDRNNKKKVRSINVLRRPYDDNIGLEIYDYKIGNKNYQLLTEPRISRVINKNNIARARHFLVQTREQYIELKKELSDLVQLSQISVYRQSYEQNLDADSRQRISAVDERLRQLFERFARYQLKLETRLNEISKRFQQDTVSSLLYNQGFDVFTIDSKKLKEIDLEKLKKDLYTAFKELGIQDKRQNIEIHLERIEKAINSLNQNQSANAFAVDDVLALPLIYRTNHIINSLSESEKEKKQMTRSRQNFFQILSDFMPSKEFNYDKNGELSFALIDDKSKYFPWTSLSSGEKQLLIQFLEVLLQESRSVIFIADEPEISLHVTWQENLLSAIRDLNENAQLIIATHSPDIVADFSDKVIDMEKVIAV